MDHEEYKKFGKEMVDKISAYLSGIREYDVCPKNVHPGYLSKLLPKKPPQDPEPFQDIMDDIDNVILPGATHWQHPHMHAFFPALNSYASMLGDMMADAINSLGFTWESNPIATELEIVSMNWLAEALELPDKFKHAPESRGGGVIYTTCSEATLTALIAARKQKINQEKELRGEQVEECSVLSKLVAYCSDQAHSSIDKGASLCMVKLRHVESDEQHSLRGDALLRAVQEDQAKGLIPFFVCGTLGTTGVCAFDNIRELGDVARDYNMWLHVDAAYAGSAFICPEFRHFMDGMHLAHSFVFNPSKWLMVHFDCTAFWVDNYKALEDVFCVNPVYLQHDNMEKSVDFMHWQIPLSRRFRALKLWFVLRSFGISGLQAHIRKTVELAAYFEELLKTNKIFDVKADRHLGLVVFQLKNNSALTKTLLSEILATRKLYVVPAVLNNETVIRFTVTTSETTREDIYEDWKLIEELGLKVLGDDYDKCFSGRCLTCNAPPSVPSEGPHINVSYVCGAAVNAREEQQQGKVDQVAVESKVAKQGAPGGSGNATGIVELGATLTLGRDRGEEGSHFDGSVSPCHHSDDEWEGEEPQGDPASFSEVNSMSSESEEVLGKKDLMREKGKVSSSLASDDSEQHDMNLLNVFYEVDKTKSPSCDTVHSGSVNLSDMTHIWVE